LISLKLSVIFHALLTVPINDRVANIELVQSSSVPLYFDVKSKFNNSVSISSEIFNSVFKLSLNTITGWLLYLMSSLPELSVIF
jgi:hypothetical protein